MATQQPIEIILLKQWSSYLAVPVWLMDDAGNLTYFNEAAEELLGARFNEVGEIQADELAHRFQTAAPDGEPLDTKELPIVVALVDRRPAYARLRIRAFDGVWRVIAVSAFPVDGHGGRNLGAVAMFWESEEE